MSYPVEFLEDIVNGKCFPFIGAGFSLNAICPKGTHMLDWHGLIEELARRASIDPNMEGPVVASCYERKFGRRKLIETLTQLLLEQGNAEERARPGDAHRELALFPFDIICTTNYDTLIEQTLENYYSLIAKDSHISRYAGAFRQTIVKVHGDLKHDLVITQDDYTRYLANYPVIADFIKTQFCTRVPIFIGYSLSDPHFRHIREVVKERLGKWFLVGYWIKFDATTEEKEELLKDSIHVLSIDSVKGRSRGEQLADFLKSVRSEMDKKILPKHSLLPGLSIKTQVRLISSPSIITSASSLCFISLHNLIQKKRRELYFKGILPCIKQLGLKPITIDDFESGLSIEEIMRTAIMQSRYYIQVLDKDTPLDYMSYGLRTASSLNKEAIILMERPVIVWPFMPYLTFSYDNIDEVPSQLVKYIAYMDDKEGLTSIADEIAIGNMREAIARLWTKVESLLFAHFIRTELLEEKYEIHISSFGRPIDYIEKLSRKKIITPKLLKSIQVLYGSRNRVIHTEFKPHKQDAIKHMKAVARLMEVMVSETEQLQL